MQKLISHKGRLSPKCYMTPMLVIDRRTNAHPSGITTSRCLTSYWAVFMFLSTFLFTSSTCLPCCGCLWAECRCSWTREGWPARRSLKLSTSLVNFIGHDSCEVGTAGNCFPCHVCFNKTLVEVSGGLLGLDILSSSSLGSCCGNKSMWSFCLQLWHRALYVSKFKISGPVVLSCGSHTALYPV